ncbi:hypothetical protein Asi03nite_39490 [Actinoplanes siamensis]|uniref:Uncharacterized protein n=1 Tax=Actinoplanes siamensis TaxID=1223317 RepID=A0A919TKU3_9ACTN|nr:hypothetical protein Asi03nite_39490 [Actinoplanes siamensis]
MVCRVTSAIRYPLMESAGRDDLPHPPRTRPQRRTIGAGHVYPTVTQRDQIRTKLSRVAKPDETRE